MANVSGPQPEIKYCPVCKSDLLNVPRNRMVSKGFVRRDGGLDLIRYVVVPTATSRFPPP